jgi:hypothetical protein
MCMYITVVISLRVRQMVCFLHGYMTSASIRGTISTSRGSIVRFIRVKRLPAFLLTRIGFVAHEDRSEDADEKKHGKSGYELFHLVVVFMCF